MTFSPMNFDQMNEADIRAEVIDPLLRLLGYRSGTELNIERERMLRYPRMSLGRKKPTDPEIRGRPDYILETRGVTVGLSKPSRPIRKYRRRYPPGI